MSVTPTPEISLATLQADFGLSCTIHQTGDGASLVDLSEVEKLLHYHHRYRLSIELASLLQAQSERSYDRVIVVAALVEGVLHRRIMSEKLTELALPVRVQDLVYRLPTSAPRDGIFIIVPLTNQYGQARRSAAGTRYETTNETAKRLEQELTAAANAVGLDLAAASHVHDEPGFGIALHTLYDYTLKKLK